MSNVIQFPGTEDEAPMWQDHEPYEPQPLVVRVQLPEPNMAAEVVKGICWAVVAFVVVWAVMS